MAKDKERSINPAQQQRKLDKVKALKKGKAELQARRNEKFARRNPERIQRQVDDLKALEASGDIKPREKTILADLERDLRAIKKAREALGDKAPHSANRPARREDGDSQNNLLGKRRHDGERKQHHNQQRGESSGSDTDESVRRIPMPKDTPPPIPHAFRRTNHNRNQNANLEPLGDGRGNAEYGDRAPQSLPPKPTPAPQVRTTYESAPQIRDLKKEAVRRFVPDVVRRKQDAVKGTNGKLVEPEEMDRLEAEGYGVNQTQSRSKPDTQDEGEGDAEAKRLAEEEERFRKEMEMELETGDGLDPQPPAVDTSDQRQRQRQVQIEEVEDEEI